MEKLNIGLNSMKDQMSKYISGAVVGAALLVAGCAATLGIFGRKLAVGEVMPDQQLV